MKEYTIPISAGGVHRLAAHGNFFMLKEPVAQTIRVIVKDSEYTLEQGQGVKNLPFAFQYLLIHNDSAVDITVVVSVGFGEYVDNRLSGEFTVNSFGTIEVTKIEALAAVASLAANASRKKLVIKNETAADQYVTFGSSWVEVGGVVQDAIKLPIGESMAFDYSGAVRSKKAGSGSVAGHVVFLEIY